MSDTVQQEELPIAREPWTSRLKRDVAHFHAKTGMKFSTIGMKAIGNARFWDRLQEGGTITLEKADEIYAWMADQGYNFNS